MPGERKEKRESERGERERAKDIKLEKERQRERERQNIGGGCFDGWIQAPTRDETHQNATETKHK